jgi:hypothetical protein
MLTTYSHGTVSVTKGSKTVRGKGVFWLDVRSCDSLEAGDRCLTTIASVDATDFTTLELAVPWCGETAEDVPYVIRFDAPQRFPGYRGRADG